MRITRRTTSQRAHLPRIEAAAADFARFAAIEGAAVSRRALEARLGPLRDALWRSPFHAERLRAAGLSPTDLCGLGDLTHFPLMDRDSLRDHFVKLPALPADDAALARLVAVESSGTTAAPVSVLRDEYECLHMWAVLRFLVQHLGVALPPRSRVVLLCALANRLEYSTRTPLLGDGALHRLSTLRDDAPERLRRAAPAVIFSDPAGLHWLAEQADPPRPRLLLSSGQHLAQSLRTRLTKRLGNVPLVNYYSTTDTGPLAWECLVRAGLFHVLLPDVWLECVRGELVVTRLRPSVLPLLRYRTGDRGRVEEDDSCRCGYRGWSILDFEGREACWFERPDGRRVDAWRLAPVFKRLPLAAFRLTQTASERFDLQIESGVAVSSDLLAELSGALQALGWPAPRLQVTALAAPTSSGGKPRPFDRHP